MPDLLRRLRRRDRGDLTCRELVELVTDYLEGALSPVDHARFESHVAGCEGCTAYLEQMRATLELLGELPEESVSPEAERDLRAAFRAWRDGSPA
jgi:predicted anti-sigma-YlaC factor YlaD